MLLPRMLHCVLAIRYEEDMTSQFSKCQEAELSRMEFFKAVFKKLESILDLTNTNRSVEPLNVDTFGDLMKVS